MELMLTARGSETASGASAHGSSNVTRSTIKVQHIRIETDKPYADVIAAIETLPRFDESIRTRLYSGDFQRVTAELTELQAKSGLVIFSAATHGEWLGIRSGRRKAIQYVIGNVLISTQMTAHHLAAGLYAPLRTVVYEGAGTTTIEYDRPSDLFGQFGDDAILTVALDLDEKFYDLLIKAAARSL